MYSLSEITDGFKKGEFFLEYLPTIRLPDERCIGGEALIRWRRKGQVIPPMEFMPAAEGTVLSGIITYWVVDQTIKELGEWLKRTNDVHIAINIPAEVWGRGGVLYAIHTSILHEVSEKIVLEVSERGYLDKIGIETIRERHFSDVKIALDDVQANQFRLMALAPLAFDFIKIDKSFSDRMRSGDWPSLEDDRTLKTVVEYGHRVIIEGVETKEQVNILRAAGECLVQGWYYSKSISADEFMSFHRRTCEAHG